MRLALVVLAACGAPVAPHALSATAPATPASEPLLFYSLWSGKTGVQPRWVSANAATGGPALGDTYQADFYVLYDATATPNGMWFLAQVLGEPGEKMFYAQAHRDDRGVVLRRVPEREGFEPTLAPDGARIAYRCGREHGDTGVCVAGLEAKSTSHQVPGTVESELVAGWSKTQLVTYHPREGVASFEVTLVDPESGARTTLGHVSGDTTELHVDPTGTTVVAFESAHRFARVLELAHLDRDGILVAPKQRHDDGTIARWQLVGPTTFVCVERRGFGGEGGELVVYTPAGRRVISPRIVDSFAALPDRVAFVDPDTQELVVTDLRGEHRVALVKVPPTFDLVLYAWVP